jgi:hypothetical protein
MDGADVAPSLWSVEAVRDSVLQRVRISILSVEGLLGTSVDIYRGDFIAF